MGDVDDLLRLLGNRQMPDDARPKVTLGELRALRAAAQGDERLDVAWVEAEATVPKGMRLTLNSHPMADDPGHRYEAACVPIYREWSALTLPDDVRVWADSPTGALRSLRAALAASGKAVGGGSRDRRLSTQTGDG